MTRVQVSEHVLINVRRRSLCDNCLVENCISVKDSRVTECDEHVAPFLAFKTCERCGNVQIAGGDRKVTHRECLRKADDHFKMIKFVR